MGCTASHQSSDSVEEPASLSSYHTNHRSSLPNNPTRSGGYATVIAGTRREGVCWCGNFCRGMLQDTNGTGLAASVEQGRISSSGLSPLPPRPSCCLHDNSGARRWTRQMCESCRYRQKEARVEKVQNQLGAIKRQIYVANGIYRNKKACCGMPCQILSISLCCYHVKPPNKPQDYCSMCRERRLSSPSSSSTFQESKTERRDEAEAAFLCRPCQPSSINTTTKNQELVQELQDQGQDVFPTVVEEECPICLEDMPIDELCRLPCGHLICRPRSGCCGMAALVVAQANNNTGGGANQQRLCCPLCRENVPGSTIILMAIDAWTKKVEDSPWTKHTKADR